MHAIRRSDLEMLAVLIAGEADVSAQNEVNLTALLSVVRSSLHIFRSCTHMSSNLLCMSEPVIMSTQLCPFIAHSQSTCTCNS